MQQQKNNKLFLYSFLTIIFILIISFGQKIIVPSNTPLLSNSSVIPQKNITSFSYTGKTSSDALTLLKQKASVIQDASGLVTTINGKKADANKHEYWAFYINGKMSDVGPANYKTKDTDTIMWKIATY